MPIVNHFLILTYRKTRMKIKYLLLTGLSIFYLTTTAQADEQCTLLRTKYRASLLGEGLDFNDKYIFASVIGNQKNIDGILKQMEPVEKMENVFTDLQLPIKGEESEPQVQALNGAYSRIRTLAIGLMTPQNKYYYKKNTRNQQLLQWTLAALRKLGEYYHVKTFPIYYQDLDGDGLVMPGKWVDLNKDGKKQIDEMEWRRCNWWHMEIGIPRDLNDIIALLYDFIPEKERDQYLDAIDTFIPSPDWTTGGAAGANGTWAVKNVALRAILAGNPFPKDTNTSRYRYNIDKLSAARQKAERLITIFPLEAGLPQSYQEGYYKDGSCISHSRNSYTGGYGMGILSDNLNLISLFEGSDYAISPEKREIVSFWIREGIIPLIAYGSIMDYTRGREIARPYEAIGTGQSALCAIMEYIPMAPIEEQKYLKSFVKRELSYIFEYIGEDTFYQNCSPESISKAKAIYSDLSVTPLEREPLNKVYPIMNRIVHHGEGFVAGVAAHSNRIFNYEGLNRENSKGWHTSDGMFYLYDRDYGQYNDGFWPTVDAYYLAGTTVEAMSSMPNGNQVGRNAWCGGVTLSPYYGTFGQQLMPAISPNLTANKSYFFIENAIVCMGSGIVNPNSSKEVITVIENRKTAPGKSCEVIVDGKVWDIQKDSAENRYTNPHWAHLRTGRNGSEIGYLFPQEMNIDTKSCLRQGVWQDINTYHPFLSEEPILNRYIIFSVNHGASPQEATYAYAIYPEISVEMMEQEAQTPRFTILDNRREVSAIAKDEVVLANFWEKGSLSDGRIEISAPASIAMERCGEELNLTITDPTQTSKKLILTLQGEYYPLEADTRILLVCPQGGKTTIQINTENLFGTGINLLLTQKKRTEEKLYGAYPKTLRPEAIKAKMDTFLQRYARQSKRMTALEKEILEHAFQLAEKVTGDTAYGKILASIKAKRSSGKKHVVSQALENEIALFRTLDSLDQQNGQADKGLTDRVIRSCSLQSQATTRENPALWGMTLHNAAWGITRPIGMMWLYSYRLPTLNSALEIKVPETDKKQQPLTDGALLLGLAKAYALSIEMSLPPSYVSSPQSCPDLAIQTRLAQTTPFPDANTTKKLMLEVAKGQMTDVFSGSAGDALDADRSWYRGSFFAGIMEGWRATQDPWYLDQAIRLSRRTHWEPGPNAMKDANDLTISQTYLELYEIGIPEATIEPTRKYLDSLINGFNPDKVEWSWCDALFMSPPTWARMGKITRDKKYFDQMDKLWWQTSNIIYDNEEHLFFRDLTTAPRPTGISLRERNGEKIFWGRGNGWVMGGLCRVLDYLPQDYPSRKRYETMFRQMCERLVETQGENGLWRVSLLDGDTYPMGETSSSTFYCYALAWGVNNGLLQEEKYRQATLKAWHGLVLCIDELTGKIGYVQLPADSPLSPVYRRSTVEYASGAFLLAGSEILTLMENQTQ